MADPGLGRRDPWLCTHHGRSCSNPDMLYLAHRHHRRNGDAAQSLSAFGRGADAPLRGQRVEDRREAIKLATIDSTIALMFALMINASILILAAATFNKVGKHRCRGARPGPFVPGATARLGDRADAVWHSAAVLRSEFHGDRNARRSDCDGGLYRYSAAGLGAPADYAGDRHHAGSDRDNLVWREPGSAKLLILSPGRLGLAVAVFHRTAGDVHRRPAQNGRARGADLGDSAGGAHGGVF